MTNPTGGRETAKALARAPWNRARAAALRNLIREWRPDVAHVYNTWFSLSPAVLVALRREGIPTVALLPNYRTQCVDASFFRNGDVCTDCLGKVPWRGVVRRCYRHSVPLSAVAGVTSTLHRAIGTWASTDSIVVPSEWMRSVLIQAGFEDELVRVLFIPTNDPGPRRTPPSASGEVVYLGRMVQNKGCLQLAEQWIANEDHLGGLKLRFIGDGPLAPEIDRLVSPSVSRSDWMCNEDVVSTLLGARALICPSLWHEPGATVAIEAFAAGLPVVASDRGVLPELVSGGAGRVAPIGDSAAWREAFLQLLNDDYVDSAGRQARAEFEARFSPAVALGNLTGLYREVMAG